MAHNTGNELGSSDPRDLLDNAANLDTAVNSRTSKTWNDRRGVKRKSWYGIEEDARKAILNTGFKPVSGSFEKGGLIEEIWQTLLYEANGMFYQWTKELPKRVNQGSTPFKTDGTLVDGWVDRTDLTTRAELVKGQYRTDAMSVYFVPGVVIDNDTDNRNAIFAFSGQIYVPADTRFRCNLLPDDDITKFLGEGKILTRDPWGNEHVFDVALANSLTQRFSVKSKIGSILLKDLNPRLGIVGDSITDGRASTSWVPNPTDSNGNLSSTNYDHDANGGKNGYLAVFRNISKHAMGLNPNRSLETFNASSSGKKLIDGWAYRNIDYGFFQNAAYKNAAPDVILLAMGHNDQITNDNHVENYLAAFDRFIRKCRGYGATVGLISNSMCDVRNDRTEAFKDAVVRKYGVEWYDIGSPLIDYGMSGKSTIGDVWFMGDLVTQYDFTHPNQPGHRFFAHYLLNEIFNTRVTVMEEGSIITAIRRARQVSYNAVTREVSDTVTIKLTDQQYLVDVDGVTRLTTDANPCFDFLIDNRVIDGCLNVIIPRPAPNGQKAKLILLNAKGQFSVNVSGDGSDLNGYYVMRVPQLDYGPNIIRVYYDGSGGSVQGYAPFLSVSKTPMSSSINQFFANIQAGARVPLTVAANNRKFHRDEYNNQIGSRLPDRMSDSYAGNISVRAKYLQGMRFWIARKEDVSYANGVYVEITSANTLSVKDGRNNAVITQLTGLSLSDGVRFAVKVTGNTMYLLSNATQSAGFPRRGGLMYVENGRSTDAPDYWIDVSMSFDG
mgnify:CR=1 FL=1